MFLFFFYSLPSFFYVDMRFVKSNVIQRLEQVIQTDLTLESIGILSLCDTEGRNDVGANSMTFAFEFADKALFAKNDLLVLGFIESINVLAILDLEERDHICSFDDQVNLDGRIGFLASPRIILMWNCVQPQGLDNLTNVPHTNSFESQAIESILNGQTFQVPPEVRIGDTFAAEVIMKQREHIHQLVDTSLLFTAIAVLSQKVAADQIFKHDCKMAIVRNLQFVCNLLASVPFLVRS